MKEAVTKVIDTLTHEDFHGALQKLLERYNKCTTQILAKNGSFGEYSAIFHWNRSQVHSCQEW